MRRGVFYLVFAVVVAMQAVGGLVSSVPGGVVLTTPQGLLRVVAMSPSIVRVSAVPAGDFPEDNSLIINPDSALMGYADFKVVETADSVLLSTSALVVGVDMTTGALKFARPDGSVVLSEPAVGGRVFVPIEVDNTAGYTVTQRFMPSSDPAEGVYGLGQHQSNEFNRHGGHEELFQYNTKVSVPMTVSTDGYGILWDGYSLGRWGTEIEHRPLRENFKLVAPDGTEGFLEATFTLGDGSTRRMLLDDLYFEHLRRDDLNKVVNLPDDISLKGANIKIAGTIEPLKSGKHDFRLYYSGYQSVVVAGDTIVPTRWRTSWNPNTYKFSVDLKAGQSYPLEVEWNPNGSVAYHSLRSLRPADADKGVVWWGEMQDMIDYYFIAGDTADDVIAGYRSLTGHAPLMPRWAMGYWQSREKYNTQAEVLDVVNRFDSLNIPLDNIVIDWLHWPQDAWGSHEFDRKRFPDPQGMVDSVHAAGKRVMISVWPKFYTTTEHYKEFDSRGWMYRRAVADSIRDWVGPGYLGSFYDAYHPEARRLFWNQIKEHYLPLGIDAWWMDASEPNIRDCTDMQYRKDLCGPTAMGPSTKYFNAYALVNAMAIYDGQRSVSDRRVFLLTRSGFAGLQRYSTATWSGDIATRWEDMEAQIPAALNFSLSGIPWWTMDIGGFCVEDRYVSAAKYFNKTGESNPDLEEWRELNARWWQFGAFAPLFRAHGQWPPREPYNIAPEGHPVYNSIVSYTRLRYRLLPYLYSLNAMTAREDYTPMRAMIMDFPGDVGARNVGDQFMLGPALLAAPVYHYGERERGVYLPAGELFYDFYTGAALTGQGRRELIEAPLERMPLLVRAGSIIPFGREVRSTAENSGPITIAVYCGRDGKFTLYDDDGETYGYERGEFSEIPMTYDDVDGTLVISDRRGEYPGMAKSIDFNIVMVSPESPVGNPQDAVGTRVTYTGSSMKVNLK
ncbi:MAG: DUF5110 domain-containing protein [Muribaculaceae bacterium]|nr:DUF5110 domain-containing protein [Muribaculaceae bacterium]